MAERPKRKIGLGIALWGLFSGLSILIIVVLLLVFNAFLKRQYLERSMDLLTKAGERAVSLLMTEGADADISAAVYDGGCDSAYLIYDEDRTVVTCAGKERSYSELEGISAWIEEHGGREAPAFLMPEGGELSGGYLMTVDGRECCLYLTLSLVPFYTFEEGFRIVSVVSALTAAVFALAVSAVLADLLARPVIEMNEKAKELARGNYASGVGKRYAIAEISSLSESLDDVKEEVTKAERVQRELIANVSHDFKTPLTMIKAYASMILEISGENREKREAHAQIIIDEADRLASLVGDVLELSRLQSGAAEEKKEVFNLSEEVYAILGRFEYLKDTQGYSFELFIGDGLYILADRTQIGQVIYNLVGNAVNYTGEDKRVRVKLERKGKCARFEVIDSGKGIPEDEVNTIFDRYYRSSKTHKRPVQGTGLGLSIVKNILLSHNFAFGVVSEVGKGSCFWAEFPLEEEKTV